MTTRFSFHSRLHFPLWHLIHTMPGSVTRLWQFFEFKQALEEIYYSVPFYQDILRSAGIHPNDIQSYDDIEQLPILSKEKIRRYPETQLITTGCEGKQNHVWNQTSGTTGMPFRYALNSFYIFHNSYHYLKYSEFCKYRFLIWRGLMLKDIITKMKVVELGVHYPRPNLQYFPLEELNHHPEAVLKKISKFRPHLLEGVPTMIIETARVYEKIKDEIHIRIPYINTHGEHLSVGNRTFLKELFGSEVYSRYGTGETGVIGVECDERNGFHILEESYIVEILDENNKPLPEGKSGRVIISFFYNTVMPFLRYETGDFGKILPKKCPCGVSARLIQIDGRAGHTTTINGKNIGIVQFEMLLSYFSDSIFRFQILKTAPDNLEIRIVPTKNFSPEVIQKIRKESQSTIGILPTISIVDMIPISTRGKTKIFIEAMD